MCYSGMESRSTGAGFSVQRCWTWLLLWWAEQKLGLPRVTAAKIRAQDQVRRGGWLLAGFHFLSSFSTQRQAPCSLLSSGINVAWCSEKVMPFFSVSLSAKTSS